MYPIETSELTNFIVYAMLSDYFVDQVGLITRDRVKMPKINQNELSTIWVTLPPKDEQQAIVVHLDRKCSAIDSAIARKQSLIDSITAYKKSLIYETVTGKREVPSA